MVDASRHRWSYSLRTLFMLVSVAAFGCWGYWIALPRWQDYREQVAFEESVKLLKAGTAEEYIGPLSRRPIRVGFYAMTDVQGHACRVEMYCWPNLIYYVVFVSPRISFPDIGENDYSIEVFRMPPATAVYEAKTESGRNAMIERAPYDTPEEIAEVGYAEDLMQFITGDRKDAFGLKYEIIYSDFAPSP